MTPRLRPLRPVIFVLAALTATLIAPAAARSGDLTAELTRLFDQLPDARVQCSALVVDLRTGRKVYARDADLPLVPASNQKILVLAAAAEQFDASAGFETVLAQRGSDLVLVGGGDPGLGDVRIAEDQGVRPRAFLDLWAHAIRAAGLAHVPGDLVIDASVFDDVYVHPDWEAADLVRWYGAPVGGLNLANNTVEVTVWPDSGGDAPALWALDPPSPALRLENRCRSASRGASATPGVGRLSGTPNLVLSGRVSERVTLQPVSVHDPVEFSATAIRAHLEKAGITFSGGFRYERVRTPAGDLPDDLVVLAVHRTPMAQVMQRIGADSQNMCAEALFKRLGVEWARNRGTSGAPGSWEGGREAVSAFLHQVGCDLNTITIADGSGLSRRNRFTATEYVRILTCMHAHPRRELFANSLAGNMTGGTLRRQMRGVNAEVYAKTGYMAGVRALSGYVRTDADRWYAFSVIFNGFTGSSRPYNDKLREMCRILADHP